MTHKIALALILSAAGVVQADDITIDPRPFVSSLTRAEVIADMQQFRRSGIDPWAQDYNQLASFQGGRTRAQVRAEYIAHRTAVAALNGEDSGSMYLAQRRLDPMQDTQMASTAEQGSRN
jgi:hypothetical protein